MISKIIGAVLIAMGVCVMVIAVIGVFRFKYVLNRMHASALCDTLGILLILSGAICIEGLTMASLKFLAIIIFMWMANPAVSHLISRAEVLTHTHIADECEVIVHDDRI